MQIGRREAARAAKRIPEAIGYLELGMTRHALASLDRFGKPGPFTAMVEMLRGEAARMEQRFDDAAVSFENAARVLPSPHDKPLWLALSDYYRSTGRTDRAIDTLGHARGARYPSVRPKSN